MRKKYHKRVENISFTNHSAWVCEATKRLGIRVDTIVEVGVWKCKGARFFRREFPAAKIILVDPFLRLRKDDERRKTRMDNFALAAYKHFQNDWNVKIIRAYSHEAAGILKGKYDLVFIDAMHTYEALKKDIEVWFPLVRHHGILAGHDYGMPKYEGIKQAVDERFGDDILIGPDFTWLHWKGKQ